MVVHVILTDIFVFIHFGYFELVSEVGISVQIRAQRSYQEPARVLQNDVKVTEVLILERASGELPKLSMSSGRTVVHSKGLCSVREYPIC